MPQPRPAFLSLVCLLALAGAAAGGALGRTSSRHHRGRAAHPASACGPGSLMPRRSNIAQIAHITLCLINRQRSAHGVRPLRENAALDRSARGHSVDMVAHGYFGHDSRDGASPFQRMAHSGYPAHGHACAMGENIAGGVGRLGTPAAIVRAWMGSPDHRANILNGSYRDTGLGAAYGFPGYRRARGATFTQDFGVHC